MGSPAWEAGLQLGAFSGTGNWPVSGDGVEGMIVIFLLLLSQRGSSIRKQLLGSEFFRGSPNLCVSPWFRLL